MSKPKSVAAATTMPTPFVPDHLGDSHWGEGGQYVLVDGKRVPVDSATTDQSTVKETNNG